MPLLYVEKRKIKSLLGPRSPRVIGTTGFDAAQYLSPLEKLSVLLAGLAHDLKHPVSRLWSTFCFFQISVYHSRRTKCRILLTQKE
jgi:hypothetical protein